MQWIRKEDHRFKTLVDVRECRKSRRALGSRQSTVLARADHPRGSAPAPVRRFHLACTS
jgi:hypothetical protein